MNDDFYTFGGGYFWEDVFFYQKWRIQRNYITKKCRLLDNWDIKRHEGSFEDCREVFVKYAEAYEIARPKGHMVVMIHGLGQSKNIFKPLWRKALSNGHMAAAINYPSTHKELNLHVKQFHFFLDHLEDIDSVSFVTLGCGNTIVQKLFEESAHWQRRLKFGRCVMINPCISENKLLSKLCRNKFVRFIAGPMHNDLTQKKLEKLSPLSDIPTGVIMTTKPFVIKILEILTNSFSKKSKHTQIKKFTGAASVIDISNYRINVCKNNDVSDAIMSFLACGKF